MRRAITVVAVVLFAAPVLAGDIYVKAKLHTDAIKVQSNTIPAKDEIMEQWIGESQMAHVSAKSTFIVDLNKKLVYFVSPKSKTYVEATLPLDFAKLLPQEMSSMLGMMKPSVTVSAGTETKKIGPWNCQAYDMNITTMGMPMKTRIWATKDVPIDLAKYRDMYAGMLKSQFMDEAAIKEMSKIDGFHILSETNAEVMGTKVRSTIEVQEISKKSAPPGIYAPPAGFTKRERLSAEDLQR